MRTSLLLIIILFGNFLLANGQAKGKVFEDLNKNQILDKNESGIENVMVSNGSDIVKTDKAGNYQIELSPGTILFVIKPRNWRPTVDKNNLSRFYYIYKPTGSPQMKYAGSAPTGALPDQINFPLYPSNEPDNFEIFVFGDPQPGNTKEAEFLAKDVISEVAGDTIRKFGISMGDIVSNNLEDYPLVNNLISKVGIPWYNVIGNHDLNLDAAGDTLSDETFETTFGPTTYAFQYGKTHFIILDDVIYKDIDTRKYIGGIRDDQFLFVHNYLAQIPKTELVVFCMHIPIFRETASYFNGKETFRVEDRKKLFDLLKDHPNTFSMSAHTHYQQHYFFTEKDGWKQAKPHQHFNVGTTCGDWFNGLINFDGFPDATMRDGTPNGYAIIKVTGSQFRIQYKVAGESVKKQMSLSIASTDSLDLSKKFAYANFYMGNNLCKVKCQFDNSNEWIDMTKVNEFDPRTVNMYNTIKLLDNKNAGKQISIPQPSAHLWKAEVPNTLSKGFHMVKVNIVDMNNEMHEDKTIFLMP